MNKWVSEDLKQDDSPFQDISYTLLKVTTVQWKCDQDL